MNRIIGIGSIVFITACVPLTVYSNLLVERSNRVEIQRGSVYSDKQAVECQLAISKANKNAVKIAHFPAHLTKSEVELLNHQIEDKCDVGKYSSSDFGSVQDSGQVGQQAKRDSGSESRDH